MVGLVSDTYYPFSSGSGMAVTDDQWGYMGSLWAPDGVSAEAPRVSLPGGLNFRLPDGFEGRVRGHHYRNVGQQDKTATSNVNTLARRDRLVLRRVIASRTITPTILQGTPSSGTPPLPALTQNATTWDVPVCYATCPGSGSAQNYSNLNHEFTGVSASRGRHAWSFQGSVDATGTVFSLTQTASSGIATVSGGANLLLTRPGIWSVTTKLYSEDGPAGVSRVWLEWPDGPTGGFDTDTRPRGSGFPGANRLDQRVNFTGLVTPAEAASPITVRAQWQAPGAGIMYYGLLYADYLGG